MHKKIFLWINNHRKLLLIFAFIFISFLVNSIHTQFPDEFDNIFGGYLINQGKLPYIGFFTHHNPGAYVLASFITMFTERSFVFFRIIFSFILFIWFVVSFFIIKNRLKDQNPIYFILYGVLIALGSTYWWGQMLLSETIVGHLLVPVMLIMIGKDLMQIRFDIKDIWIISLLTFLSLFTSLTYIYFIPFVLLITFYFYLRDNKPFTPKNIITPLIIFTFPYLIFFIYLILTGSLFEFYFASIYYNVNYYIYNFPKVAGIHSHHPVRYAISIARNSIDGISALLTQIPSFNLSYPMNISLALGNLIAIIYFLLKRRFGLTLLLTSMMIYTNARSEPLNIHETDFHATVYIMLTIATTMYIFSKIKNDLDKKYPFSFKSIFAFLFILGGVYWLFAAMFWGNSFMNKAYDKLMGNAPLIYDRPQTGRILNTLLTKDDYYWIGPFELQELLFINGQQASKYFWFLPANSRDEKIKREIIADFDKTKPKVILFKDWWSNFGVTPEQFNTTIVTYLDKNYFQLEDLKNEGLEFTVNMPRERDFDFENELYFRKDQKEKIVAELFSKNLIQK